MPIYCNVFSIYVSGWMQQHDNNKQHHLVPLINHADTDK